MKMRILIIVCCVLLCDKVSAEEEENKKDGYSFMAFIYYPHEVETLDKPFLRGAVLVKPEWLLTSNVGPLKIDTGFPKKTLMARLGAALIDTNFALNEDEDEQQSEVIHVVRPYNYSEVEWWLYDVTLLKTLLPFNTTDVIMASISTSSRDYSNSECFMLVYASTKRNGNWTEDKMLMPLPVDLQTSDKSCGSHYQEATMMCAEIEDIKTSDYDHEFCHDNSGGPLICEKEVAGIQIYIDNSCKPPYLYQHLPAWKNFITCGLENKCGERQCNNVCEVIDKDVPVTQDTTTLKDEQKDTTVEGHRYTNTEEHEVTTTKDGRKSNTYIEEVHAINLKENLNTPTTEKGHVFHLVSDVAETRQKEDITTRATINIIVPDENATIKDTIATELDTSEEMTTLTLIPKTMEIIPTTPIINKTLVQEETENMSLSPDVNNSTTLDEDVKDVKVKKNSKLQKLVSKVKKNSAEREIFVPVRLLIQFILISLMM